MLAKMTVFFIQVVGAGQECCGRFFFSWPTCIVMASN